MFSLDKRGKWSRKRANEDEGDVTYINQRNKVFNKKVSIFPGSFRSLNVCRSRASTTNTRPKYVIASSVELPSNDLSSSTGMLHNLLLLRYVYSDDTLYYKKMLSIQRAG